MQNVYYHTRHIPIEHIRLDHPKGQMLVENLLSDSIRPPCSDKLRDYGTDIIETRLIWNEMEPEPGRYDFSRFEKAIETIRAGGFGVGVFPWFQHPPKWYTEGVRLKCPLHGDESTILSLWDGDRLLDIYDRLYGELARRYGDKIDFLYVGVYSDYGEVCMPLGVGHYYFSPDHICRDSMWDADICATESRERYFSTHNSLLAYADWYTNSVMDFTDRVCAIVRKHFPNTRAAIPIGCVGEKLKYGQIKRRSAQIAAKYNMTARWTGWCLDGDYGLSHIGTRRVSTAARFYGADFGLETPLYLSEQTAPYALFEALSNNPSIIHNDPGNIFRAYDVYKPLRDAPVSVPFLCDKAVFYPLEAELLDRIDFVGQFAPACAELRRHCDFEAADSQMIEDGYTNDLIFTPAAQLPEQTADTIRKRGLNVIYCKDAPPILLESGKTWRYGTPIADFDALGKWNGCYTTRRQDGTVVLDTEKNVVEIRG